MKTHRIETVRELREWLDGHDVPGDAKVRVRVDVPFEDGDIVTTLIPLVVGRRGLGLVEIQAN
jgi:hypothetical protein